MWKVKGLLTRTSSDQFLYPPLKTIVNLIQSHWKQPSSRKWLFELGNRGIPLFGNWLLNFPSWPTGNAVIIKSHSHHLSIKGRCWRAKTSQYTCTYWNVNHQRFCKHNYNHVLDSIGLRKPCKHVNTITGLPGSLSSRGPDIARLKPSNYLLH